MRKCAPLAMGLAAALLAIKSTDAAPMAYYAGGTMAMLDVSATEREASLNYSLTPQSAIGVRSTWMQSSRDPGYAATAPYAKHAGHGLSTGIVARHTSAELTVTHLLHRWNTEGAQTNIWAFAGIGALRSNTFAGERFAYSPGMQVDFETTRLYASLKGQMHRARGINSDTAAARLGASFWEAEYEETQPWIVIEARRTREFSERIEITPMLRLVNRRYFAELGVNQDGKVRASLMYIFDFGR